MFHRLTQLRGRRVSAQNLALLRMVHGVGKQASMYSFSCDETDDTYIQDLDLYH